MWSSSGLRIAGLAVALVAAPSLTACSGLTPVYGTQADTQHFALIYAKPNSRFEQVVYEDLALKLGKDLPVNCIHRGYYCSFHALAA